MRLIVLLCFCLTLGLPPGVQRALAAGTRVWDIKFGIPVSTLPPDDFVDPACGTNGGPRSLPLESFADFARCPVEASTGLREVWFIYDDEAEYIARAERDEGMIARYSANVFFDQPIITSLLIDNAGLVQGYRVVTDPRAPAGVRIDADQLSQPFKAMFNSAWVCADLPRLEGELPIEGIYVKQSCSNVSATKFARIEVRHYFKPGQDIQINKQSLTEAANEFESSVRFEVFNPAAVKDAACCQASLHP